MKYAKEFMQEQKLVSIRRDKIDSSSIQGFILELSDELVLLQYVYDFNLDGLMILRFSDITEIKCSATEELQKQLLIEEQLFKKIDFGFKFNTENWKTILTQLSSHYDYCILEDEEPDEPIFLIGKIQKIGKSDVSINYFSGAGNWDEKPSKLAFNKISSCQVNTNYLNVYQRYFATHALTHPSSGTPKGNP
jgi:hypothetical protein